jgi:pilus assembly protein CpaE
LVISVTLIGGRDRQIQEMLSGSKLRLRAGTEGDLVQLSQPNAAQPHAIILDLREQSALPGALVAVKRHHPNTGVVIVASKLDPTLMLEAMRAGVTEWIVDPLTPGDLEAAVRRVVQTSASVRPTGEVFAFIGAKGGVGSTTVAVNVATALSKSAPGEVLFVDLHLAHGDAALYLGVEPRFSVIDALENSQRLDEAFLKSLIVRAKCGVDLLASSERAVAGRLDPTGITALLELAATHYRYIVLDVPRLDVALVDALEIVKTFAIVANQELTTVRSTARLAATLRQRYGTARVKVLVTRYDQNAQIGQQDVERVVGMRVAHLFPSNYRLAIDALNAGRPIVVENHNKLAASFVGFARDLAGVAAETPTDRGTGIFGRLSGRK